MKIAFSADLHLTTREERPERYNALTDILTQMKQQGVKHLILAGDTFDESSGNYGEFDSFCTQPEWSDLTFLIIPGNHDDGLRQEHVTAHNVHIVDSPTVKCFSDSGLQFLLVPYESAKTMGESIAATPFELVQNQWILVGHGDWIAGMQEPNPDEPGVYMPLTRTDLDLFQPRKVILGHIHKPSDDGRVTYIGSPCGLDVREIGRRRFLLMDDHTGDFIPQVVHSDLIFFNESFVSLPVENEEEHVAAMIQDRIKSWQLAEDEIDRVRIQIKWRGFTSDKKRLHATIMKAFSSFSFYNGTEPDLTAVSIADDENLAEIARRVSARVGGGEPPLGSAKPDSEEILLAALNVIYGT